MLICGLSKLEALMNGCKDNKPIRFYVYITRLEVSPSKLHALFFLFF